MQLDVVDVVAHAADEARVLLAQHPAVADGVLVVVGVLEVLGGGGDAVVQGGHDALPTVSVGSARLAACSAAHWIDRTIVV